MIQATDKKRLWFVVAQHAAAALLALGVLGGGLAHALDVKVRPDEARIVAVAGKPATVVVGNPLYTKVAVISNNKLLVQGRNPGKTNVIVLDSDGNRLAAFNVVVNGMRDGEVALYKQGRRSTYLCAPECSQVPSMDDDSSNLANYAERTGSRRSVINP